MRDEKDRVRENARAVVEEVRREQDAWFMRETTVGLHDWAARQNVPITKWSCLFYRVKDHREETPENTASYPREAKKARVRGLCDRLNGLDEKIVEWLRSRDAD